TVQFYEYPAWAEPARPNVLMIVVDDMNDWVGCLGGHPDVRTPHIDRLAKRGQLFSNAHCAAPVCNASRVAVMTGRRPSSTDVYANNVVWHNALPQINTIPAHFKRNGYHVAGGGKLYHHSPGFNRPSDWHTYFDQVFDSPYQNHLAQGGQASSFEWPRPFPLNQLPSVRAMQKPPLNPGEFDWGALDRDDLAMGDGQMIRWAIRYLQQPPSQPFFLSAGIFRPHLPFYAPRQYFERYPADAIELPIMREDDVADLPPAGQKMAASRRGDFQLIMNSGKHRELVQAYLASISYADALIGQLLDALDASPAAKNTIVVLWSDHGWHLGEKQHLHKFTLWERSTRVPFIVVAPGVTSPASQSSRPVGLVDLFPTLVDLCQLPSVEGLDGTSLMPLLRNPTQPWHRPAVTTQGRGNHAVRSERYRYIRYADGGEELYDHQADPHEWHNLAKLPDMAAIKEDLAKFLP
ncbi:MAG: sulfatase, partial [Pirellulaceae bacterium]|nr:sulfatase [Pirellulaceae bacterium]